VLDSLKYLHEKDILHRNLIPANILMNGQLICKQAVLSEPKYFQCLSIPQTENAPYIAPEVLNGLPNSKSADMWSFGAIIYELCTLNFQLSVIPTKRYIRPVF